MVKNYMETLVEESLQRELANNPQHYADLCDCASCRAALRAAALNRLKPFYVTCIAGEVYGEYRGRELQNAADVAEAIIKGAEEVRAAGCSCQQGN